MVVEKLLEFTVNNARENAERSRDRTEHDRVTINGDDVPTFDPAEEKGLKAADWLISVEQIKELHRWSDNAAIHFAVAKLKGSARIWWNNLSEKRLSWEDFHQQVLEAFPKCENYADLTRRMVDRRKRNNESYIEYYYEKMALLGKIGFTGQMAIDCLADGITDPFVRSQVRSGVYSTPGKLLEYLSSVNTISGGRKEGAKRSQTDQTNSTSKTPSRCYNCQQTGHIAKYCKNQKEGGSSDRQRGQTHDHKNQNGAKKNDEKRQSGTSTRSGKNGNSEQQKGGDLLCYKCNEKGHFAKACPNQKATIPKI